MCPDKLDTTAEFQTWRRVRVGQRRLSRFCQPMYFFPEKGLSQNRPPPSARVCSHPATTRSPQNRVFFFWKLHVSSYHTPALLRLPLFKTGNRNECPHRPGPVWETLHDISFHPHESWELASITLVLGMENSSKLPKVVGTTECPGLQPKPAGPPTVLHPLHFGFLAPLFIRGAACQQSFLRQTAKSKPWLWNSTHTKESIKNKPVL